MTRNQPEEGTAEPELDDAEPARGQDTDRVPDEREKLVAARRELGRQLAVWRARARLSQTQLARRTGYSRSAVASAEAGEPLSAAFWAAADQATCAGGALKARQARIEAVVSAARQRAARQAWVARAEAAEPGLAAQPDDGGVAIGDGPCPHCAKPIVLVSRVTTMIVPPITGAPQASPPPD